jgi:hypothetical protein
MDGWTLAGVASQPHVVMTHAQFLGGSLVLRIPEFVKAPDGAGSCCPDNIIWEQMSPSTQLRYRWDVADSVKQHWATDIQGQARADGDVMNFEVTMRNAGDVPQPWGAFLFCLQCGAWGAFQDYDGQRTFVHTPAGWKTVNQMQAGLFEDHRMCVFPNTAGGASDNLMAKISLDGQWVLAMAIDRPGWVSCNHQIWPSCIHANPVWGRLPAETAADPKTCGEPLPPGASVTAHGKVYLLGADLDALYERYTADFA